MHGTVRDLTVGWRRLCASPAFTVFSILTLPLGIGFTTAIYSVVRAVIRLMPAVDPFALAVAPLALIAAAVLACYFPARRASKVDPNVALREL